MTFSLLIGLICAGLALWWRMSILRDQNEALRAEILRLRSQLRASRH